MLHTNTLHFLSELKENNHKEWFEANRKRYEAAKADYLSLVAAIINGIAENDAPIGQLEPKACVFRINRDVRFSKDKSPYKTNMGAGFTKGGKKMLLAGYYFHCEPGASFIAGGMWMPPAPELKKIRQEIDYNLDSFQGIIQNDNFVNTFGGLERSAENLLSRPPKGYEEGNPAIEWLKLKSFIVSRSISDKELLNKSVVSTIVSACSAMQPLIYFINQALE